MISKLWGKIKKFLLSLTWEDIFNFLKNYRNLMEEIGKAFLALYLLIHLIIGLVVITKQDLGKIWGDSKDTKIAITDSSK